MPWQKAAVETCERVRAERRLAFQLRLADALRSVNDPVQLAEHAAAQLGVIDTMPAGLIMMDENGTLLIENDEWKRTWGGNAGGRPSGRIARHQGVWCS